MWRSRLNPLVLSLALVLLLVAVVASSAAANGTDEPVVVGHLPAVPILKEAAAKGAAWAQVRKFRHHSPLARVVSFRGCERDGLEEETCTFQSRGGAQPDAPACRLTVVVSGLAAHLESDLHSFCRANPTHFLTIRRAKGAIKSAAEAEGHEELVVDTPERLGAVELLIPVIWHRGGSRSRCEAQFIARLSEATGVLVVTHTPRTCT